MIRHRFARTALAAALTVSGPAAAFDFGVHVEDLLDAHSDATVRRGRAPGRISACNHRRLSHGHAEGLRPGAARQGPEGRIPDPQRRQRRRHVRLLAERRGADPPDRLHRRRPQPADRRPEHGAYAPGDKFNPSVQRIDLASGAVETILRGMTGCDGIRTTPWGTVLATEETDDGGAYELLTPLATTNYTVKDRATGEIVDAAGATDSDEIVKRGALPTIAWEGLDLTPEGVVYAGDEERPGSTADGGGSTNDRDGGAIFKFVPATPWTGAPVTSLAQSPLVAGSVYAYQASCQAKTSSSFPQYGQGCEIGQGAWVQVNGANARVDAHDKGATGYYRPEDGHFDPLYAGPGVRFCWTNTGNEGATELRRGAVHDRREADGHGHDGRGQERLHLPRRQRRGEGLRRGEGEPLRRGRRRLQLGRQSRLPAGHRQHVRDRGSRERRHLRLPAGRRGPRRQDRRLRQDPVGEGLVSAEPTGFMFSADGTTAYVSIQHSNDANMTKVDDYATDDILKITGFKVPGSKGKGKD